MSERFVKIAIALSLLCLIASAVFYVSSIEDTVGADSALSTEKPKDTKAPKHRRGFESSFDSFGTGGNEQPSALGGDALAPVEGADGDPLEDEGLGGDGLVAGSVYLKRKGVGFDEVQLYLVQTRAYEDETALSVDEGGEVVEEGVVAELEDVPPEDAADEVTEEESGAEGEAEEEVALEEDYEYQEPIYLDENGEFEHILAPGEYKLVARAPGHTPVAVEGIAVRAGEEVRGLVVELEEGLKIAGYVRTNETDIETLEGLEVTLEGEGFRLTRYTDGQGAFEFEGLPKGTFKVSAFDTLVGKAERTASAGETTVALDMRHNEITGTVVDQMGMPVADVEVIGRGRYQLAAAVDKDPHGSTDGMPDPPPEELAAVEEQYAMTDEQGRFTMKMASDSKITLSVQTFDDGSAAYMKDVPPSARGVQLRLSPGKELKLRIAKLPEGVGSTPIDLTPEDDLDSPFYAQTQSSAVGVVVFTVPEGVNWVLTYDKRAQIEVVGGMPSNVKVGELFVRGGPRAVAIKQPSIHIERQVQLDPW